MRYVEYLKETGLGSQVSRWLSLAGQVEKSVEPRCEL